MTLPKVFVGTMYCGEGDFPRCKESIKSQQGVDVSHVIVENMPEKQAHNALWALWRAANDGGFAAFVKVDADTVLAGDNVLATIVDVFRSSPRVTGIQSPLLDYFTAGFINGLNAFAPCVTFNDTVDDIYCDRNVDVGHDLIVSSDQVPPVLRPAGFHCYAATPLQAYHFGVHRALKNQTATLAAVKRAWSKEGGDGRAYALLGAADSSSIGRQCSYGDQRLLIAFDATKRRFDQRVNELRATL